MPLARMEQNPLRLYLAENKPTQHRFRTLDAFLVYHVELPAFE